MNSNPSLANERLRGASRAKDQVKRWTWLLVIAAVAVVLLISFVSADYWLLPPSQWSYGAFAILAAVAMLGALVLCGFFRKPTSLKEAALDAEGQRAEEDCVVSTAAEYIAGKTLATNEYEPQLATALQNEAGHRLEQVQLPYRRTLWVPALVFGAAVIGLVVFLILTPSSGTAVKRVTLPWLNAHYTAVQVRPGDAELRSGTDVEIASAFTGRSPKAPRIEWQEGETSAWHTASLTESAPMKFAFPLKNVTNSMTYRVLGGDAISPMFQLTPYVPPELTHFSVNVASPEYTKLKPTVQQSTNFTVLRGSTATVHVRANVDLSRARIRFADTNTPALELRAGENGLWSGNFPVRTNTDYFVELFDGKGRQGGNEKPFAIATKGDEPPRVEILEPGQDMRAEATNKIPVKISAADDFGVGEVKLVFHKLRDPDRSVVALAQSEKNGELIATAEIDLAPLNLQTNELVAYYAEAKDNNNLDGPGVGKSQVFFIEITNKESSGTPLPMQPMPNERVNLLTVQKQIIADTVALRKDSPTNEFGDLTLRQKDTTDFATIHLDSMKIAPAEAITEMQSAIAAMEKASAELEKSSQAGALPPEEDALARLYRVLALMPQLKMTNLAMRPPTNSQQRLPPPPKLNVVMEEIRKRKPPEERQDPEVVAALQTAEQLSDLQAQLNEAEQQLALVRVKDRPQPDEAGQPSEQQTNQQQQQQNNQQAQGRGQGRGQGAGQGQGEGQGQGQGQPGQPQKGEAQPQPPKEQNQTPAEAKTQLAQTQTQTQKSNQESQTTKEPQKDQQSAEEKKAAKPPETQLAQNPQSTARPPSGQGQRNNANAARKGNANGAGRGRGAGMQPGSGQGRGGQQLGAQPPDMAQAEPQKNEDEPKAEQLAAKQEQLSKEAQALAEKLERLAGKGTRVGHNVAVSANKASEGMKGAAEALKQGNAAGAGRRGTESSQELDKVVTALQRALAARPDLIDVSAEEAPKEYEGIISEYFRKLSYEK